MARHLNTPAPDGTDANAPARAALALDGRWPFLDDDFACTRVLMTAAMLRLIRRDGPSPAPSDPAALVDRLQPLLQPDTALAIRRLDFPAAVHGSPPTEPLAPAHHAAIDRVLADVGARIPAWAPLLRLPVHWRRLPDGRGISASNFPWPQHILLADAAFTSDAQTAEQIVHELVHQWTYAIEEATPLQQPIAATRITLPSGTSGRSPAELLGAAHVATALDRLWRALDVPEHARTARLNTLDAYRSGCSTLIDEVRHELTPAGLLLADRITHSVNQGSPA